MNVFGGTAYLDVMELAKYRHLDTARFENLLMKEKAVALPYDPHFSMFCIQTAVFIPPNPMLKLSAFLMRYEIDFSFTQ